MLCSVVRSTFNILEERATLNFKITACCFLGLIFDLEDGNSKLCSHCCKNLKTHAVERMFEQISEKQKSVIELKQWDGSVRLVARLQAGHLSNWGSIPRRGRNLSLLPSTMIGSGGHPAFYRTGTRGKAVGV